MAPSTYDERAAELARRAQWLERHRGDVRRTLVIVTGVLAAVFAPYVYGEDWTSRLVCIPIAFGAFVAIELAIPALIATWEVRHDRIVRSRGLPRAILYRRNKNALSP